MIEFLPPEVLDAGKVQLRWRIRGARLVVLEGHGEVPAEDGGQVVEVGRTTTFVLTAYGDELGAVDSRCVTVTVPEPPFEQQMPVGTIALWHGDPAWIPSGLAAVRRPRAARRTCTTASCSARASRTPATASPGDAHVHVAMVVITGRSEPHGQHAHDGRAGWEIGEAATPARWYNRWRGRVDCDRPGHRRKPGRRRAAHARRAGHLPATDVGSAAA